MLKTFNEILESGKFNLQNFERSRKQNLKSYKLKQLYNFLIIASILFLLFFVPLKMGYIEELAKIGLIVPIMLSFVAIVLLLSVYIGLFRRIKYRFQGTIKDDIITKIIKSIDSNFVYKSKEFIPKKTFMKSKFFGFFSIYKGEDYFSGKIYDIPIEFSDILLQSTSGKNRQTIFRGPFFAVKLPKKFKGRTAVLSSLQHHGVNKFIQKVLKVEKKDELITIDNPDFHKLFKILSTNETESKQILQNDICNLLIELRNNTIVRNIGVYFTCYEDYFYLAFNNVNIFHINIKQEINKETLQKYYDEFIKYINLLLKIYSLLEENIAN